MKTTAQNLAEITAINGELLSPCAIGLYQNDVSLNPLTSLADLEIATFSGYAGQTITEFSEPIMNPDGSATILGGLHTYMHDGGVVANIIYGAYLVDDLVTPTVLRYAWALDTPIGMAGVADGLAIVPHITLN